MQRDNFTRIKFTPVTLISLGLLLIIIVSLIETPPDKNYVHILSSTVLILLKELGLAFVIAGGVTIVIELNDFMQYFLHRLTEVMVNEKYIDLLTHDQKKKIRKILDRKLYFPNSLEDPDSFFYTVEEQVIPLLNKCYYEEYGLIVECFIDEENRLIKKSTTKTMKVVNPTDDYVCEEIPIWNYMSRIDDFPDEDLFRLSFLTIDGDDKTVDFQPESKIIDNDCGYNILFLSDQTIDIKDSCIVRSKTESVVPITDILYHHKLSKPCKKYHITFLLPDNRYYVVGHAFGFGVTDEEDHLEIQILQNGICITFENWTLPGDGIIFTIIKKE